MSRSIERLNALKVERLLKKPGMYCDGGGLWLCVSSASAASWLFRYAAPHPYIIARGGQIVEKPAGSARIWPRLGARYFAR